jgi:HSP20 family protein
MYPSLMRFPGNLFADFGELQRQVEQLLDARSWPSSIRAVARGAFPAINMGATAEAIEIYALAPGIDPNKIDVQIVKGLLTISGERLSQLPAEGKKVSVYANERFNGSFRRVVHLPDDADTGKVDASYKDGVLRIVIPKREASKPRQIEVRT